MKAYRNFAILPLALLFAALPAFSYAKENGRGFGLGLNAEVSTEQKMEHKDSDDDWHEKRAFILPWGIAKKLGIHASSSASTTASTTAHAKVSLIATLRAFFKNLVSGNYNLSIVATDQNGLTSTTSLGAFIKR